MPNLPFKIKGAPRILKDIALNRLAARSHDLFYVIENAPWSIAWDGHYITRALNQQKLIRARTVVDHVGLRRKIIHFGSESIFFNQSGIVKFHPSNQIVFTWFHIAADDQRVQFIPQLNQKADLVHTSAGLTRDRLVKSGLDPAKIRVIPLGVDLSLFQPVTADQKAQIRKSLKIPPNKIVIGSFQKDGQGWGRGDEPKLVKGPDIFCAALEKLPRKKDLHVLLTGPARGYVKNRLQKAGISYTHRYLKDYTRIARYYQALDCYLIASRYEGGPKAILEAWASGVPVISTPVGMAPDIVSHQENALLAEARQSRALVPLIQQLLDSSALRTRIIENSLKDVQQFGWSRIAQRYYTELYQPLIDS